MGILIYDKSFRHFRTRTGKVYKKAFLNGYWVDSNLEDVFFEIRITSSGALLIKMEKRYRDYFKKEMGRYLDKAKKSVESMISSKTQFNVDNMNTRAELMESKYTAILKKRK